MKLQITKRPKVQEVQLPENHPQRVTIHIKYYKTGYLRWLAQLH